MIDSWQVQHRGWLGEIARSDDNDGPAFRGKLTGATAVVLCEGNDFIQCELDFWASVDDWLADCDDRGIDPETYRIKVAA